MREIETGSGRSSRTEKACSRYLLQLRECWMNCWSLHCCCISHCTYFTVWEFSALGGGNPLALALDMELHTRSWCHPYHRVWGVISPKQFWNLDCRRKLYSEAGRRQVFCVGIMTSLTTHLTAIKPAITPSDKVKHRAIILTHNVQISLKPAKCSTTPTISSTKILTLISFSSNYEKSSVLFSNDGNIEEYISLLPAAFLASNCWAWTNLLLLLCF